MSGNFRKTPIVSPQMLVCSVGHTETDHGQKYDLRERNKMDVVPTSLELFFCFCFCFLFFRCFFQVFTDIKQSGQFNTSV